MWQGWVSNIWQRIDSSYWNTKLLNCLLTAKKAIRNDPTFWWFGPTLLVVVVVVLACAQCYTLETMKKERSEKQAKALFKKHGNLQGKHMVDRRCH